jgi:hypothetical protein
MKIDAGNCLWNLEDIIRIVVFTAYSAHTKVMETRRSYRLDLFTDLTVMQEQKELHGSVINVGLSGVLAKVPTSLDLDVPYRISFQLKPDRTIFKSWGRVAWTQEHDAENFLIGLQFERIETNMYHHLADYISQRWINEHLSPGSYGSQ